MNGFLPAAKSAPPRSAPIMKRGRQSVLWRFAGSPVFLGLHTMVLEEEGRVVEGRGLWLVGSVFTTLLASLLSMPAAWRQSSKSQELK
ncbi:MAG: hypothetical protein QW035_03780 [Candidatus Anstonellales archaeon]